MYVNILSKPSNNRVRSCKHFTLDIQQCRPRTVSTVCLCCIYPIISLPSSGHQQQLKMNVYV